MQACPHCSFQNADGRTICKQCGQDMKAAPKLVQAPPEPIQAPPQPVQAALPPPSTQTVPPPSTAIPPKKRSYWARLGIGTGIMVVGCCVLLAIIGALAGPTRTASAPTPAAPSAVAVVAIEPTRAPTNTPKPPATARPTGTPRPTSLPRPTRTPQPTAVPEPASQFTDEEQVYWQTVIEKLEPLGEALQEIGELASAFDGTDAWKIRMATQMARVSLAHQELSELEPPERFTKFHGLLLESTSDCDASMDAFARGIDNTSVSDLEDAATLMNSCTAKLQPAMKELQQLQLSQ